MKDSDTKLKNFHMNQWRENSAFSHKYWIIKTLLSVANPGDSPGPPQYF